MPISEDEWASGRAWTDLERAIAEFLGAVDPRAYSVSELHELLVDGGAVVPPGSDDDSGLEVVHGNDHDEPDRPDPGRIDVARMDVTEREVRDAVTGLRDAEYLDSKEIRTADGFVTYYRRCDCGMF